MSEETDALSEVLSTEECWRAVCETLRQRLAEHTYRTYVGGATVLSSDEGKLRLGYRNGLVVNVVSNVYREAFEEELLRVSNRRILVLPEAWSPDGVEPAPARVVAPAKVARLSVEDALVTKPRVVEPLGEGEPPAPRRHSSGLDLRHTFDSFVVGPSNQFAFAACKAVADGPGKTYNPLFIWGGSGLGKTHLMQAVGNKALADNPKLKLLYVTSEQFMNELISSIQTRRTAEFRARYRECDMLLIDDIQFVAGKASTEEEFFHTFNTLHGQGKQIIVTSDRVPHDIDKMEERLRSRFQWGLISDVQPPEMETRVAILKAKAQTMRLRIEDDVAQFIALYIRQNVRELEGCLTRLAAYASLIQGPLTVDTCKDMLKSLLVNRGEKVDCEQIIKACADYFRVTVADIKGPVREKQIARARQVAMYLCRKLTNASYPELGKRWFGKDHSTVLTACQRVPVLMAEDSDFRRAVETLERELSASM